MDIKILGELQNRMDRAVGKATVATTNLANLETPGYRTQEPVFSEMLDDQLASPLQMSATHAGHLSSSDPVVVSTKEADGLQPRRDGNNVQLDCELLKLSGAGGEFKRAAAAYDAIAKQLRYAITESK